MSSARASGSSKAAWRALADALRDSRESRGAEFRFQRRGRRALSSRRDGRPALRPTTASALRADAVDLERRRLGARRRKPRAGSRARRRGDARERALAVGAHLGHGRPNGRLSSDSPQRFFSRDYRAGIRRHLRARPSAPRADRLCLRPGSRRRGAATTAAPRRPSAPNVFCLVNAPARPPERPLTASGDAIMRAGRVSAAGDDAA